MKKFILFLIVVVLLVSVFYGFNPPKTEVPKTPDKPQNVQTDIDTPEKEAYKKTVSLFFASANELSVEKRQIEAETESDIYKVVIEELIKGPQTASLSITLHPGTQVNSVTVNNKIATVDFTDSIKKLNTGGSTKEYLCMYSIVNTLCSFDEIDSVLITINGSRIETFGQLDASEPIIPD